MNNIDKIKTEIRRLKGQLIRGACASQVAMETRCKDEAYDEILSFIDSLSKEHESNIELIQRSWYLEGYDDAKNGMEPMWTVEACKGGPEVEKNPRYEEYLKENYFKKEGEADKQAVKKLTKEVSKDIAGQVKKAMKEQDICSGCTNVKGCVTCVDGNMKEVDEVKDKELEEAAERYEEENTLQLYDGGERTIVCLKDVFVAGAKWQKEQDHDACRTCEKSRDAVFYKGMEYAKEQMMKEAVEAYIEDSFVPASDNTGTYFRGFTCIYEEKGTTPYVVGGNKIKLIILKEDENRN